MVRHPDLLNASTFWWSALPRAESCESVIGSWRSGGSSDVSTAAARMSPSSRAPGSFWPAPWGTFPLKSRTSRC